MTDIYDLESLALKEGINYSTLRTIVRKLRLEGKPLEWRDYKLFGHPGKSIYAYKSSDDITVHLVQKEN